MEAVVHGTNTVVYASTNDSLDPPAPGAIRLRRLPRPDAHESLNTESTLPEANAVAGPLELSRPYAEEPMAIILGHERRILKLLRAYPRNRAAFWSQRPREDSFGEMGWAFLAELLQRRATMTYVQLVHR